MVSRLVRFAGAVLIVMAVLVAGCTNDEGGRTLDANFPGGASDLPGPPPSDVEFRRAPRSSISAPDFSANLIDGTPVTASDLWAERPIVLMFTASWCDRCADLHREVSAVVDEYEGSIALLAVVPEDDLQGARDYAQELELGDPIAVGNDDVWLNYAADEPPLVALVAPGGRVLRGWPGGVEPEDLAKHLDNLFVSSAGGDG
jgi:thiol-disulfide isomerase/thioredoxin